MSSKLVKIYKSHLLRLTLLILLTFIFFFWIGIVLLVGCLVFLVIFPHLIPTPLIDEIALVDLIVRDRLTRRWKSLNQRWWHEIMPGLYLGGIPLLHYSHLSEFKQLGVQAVYAILEDHEANFETFCGQPIRPENWAEAGIFYERLKCRDMQPLTLQQLKQAAKWIHLQRSKGKIIYVHCKNGRGRSPMAVIAYLMQYHHLSLAAAQELVLKRAVVRFRPLQRQRMEEFERCLNLGEKGA